jgi:hypothetical protein
MAHPLHFNSPSDLRRQARRARHLAPAVARPWKTHRSSAFTAARPRDTADARPVRPGLPQPLRELDGGHPLPLPARIRMPAALVAGRRFSSLRDGPAAHPSPGLLQPALQRLWRAAGRSGASTRRSRSRRRVGVTPTDEGATHQAVGNAHRPGCFAGATSGVPRVGHHRLDRGATRSSRPGRAR